MSSSEIMINVAAYTFWSLIYFPTLVYLCCKLGRYGWLIAELQFTRQHSNLWEKSNGSEEQDEA